jgi:hypothetical protein
MKNYLVNMSYILWKSKKFREQNQESKEGNQELIPGRKTEP